MTPREIEQMLANVGQLVNLVKLVNINKEAINHHVATKKIAEKRLEGYTEQYNNKEYMDTLSPVERKCLMDNAQNIYMTHQSLNKELDYLDLNKQPLFVLHTISELEHLYLYMQYLLEMVDKDGATILPHLQCIKIKHFEGGSYKGQIQSIYSELEAMAWDFHHDFVQSSTDITIIPIFEHLAVSCMWIKQEKERLEIEAMPEIRKIELPKETTPEIPAGPDDKNTKSE